MRCLRFDDRSKGRGAARLGKARQGKAWRGTRRDKTRRINNNVVCKNNHTVSGSTKAAIDRSRKELGINVSKICEKAINDEIASLNKKKVDEEELRKNTEIESAMEILKKHGLL